MIKKIVIKLKTKFANIQILWAKVSERYTLLRIASGVICRIKDDQISRLSAQITYYLLLALFPFMIFLLNLLQFFHIEQSALIDTINKIVPAQSSDLVFGIVNEVISSSGVTLLSLGMITTLWSASKGADAIIAGLNKAYDVKEERSFFMVKGVGLLVTLGIPVMILASLLFLVLGDQIGQFLFEKLGLSEYIGIWEMLRIIIPLSGMTIYFTMLYKLAPNRYIKLKQAVVGAVFATVGWIGISMLFSLYVGSFGNYSEVYGGLGSIIVLLLWLNLSSTILIVGGEINAEISKPHLQREELSKEETSL